MDLPRSFWMRRAISSWESSRSKPRRAPSTSRRYRSFSPSRILQSVIIILQVAIVVKREFAEDLYCWKPGGQRGEDSSQRKHITRRTQDGGLVYTEWDLEVQNGNSRSEEHTSELQSLRHLVCR